MTNLQLIRKLAENQAKRDLLLEIMEDLRLKGQVELHLKYMEMYDSLKNEYKEMHAQFNALAA